MSQTDPSDVNQHIREEHETLVRLIGELHRALTERDEPVADVARLVCSLQEHLAIHFREEEDDGFFDQIVDLAPRFSEQTDELREEHAQLNSELDELAKLAGTEAGSDEWWQRLEQGFHHLGKHLMHHEHKENELLQDAYEDDIGSKD